MEFAFNICGADAVTVHPYMGSTAMEPFLRNPDKGVFVLCRTSNKGGEQFQQYGTPSLKPLYRGVAETVVREWNRNVNCGLVMGATNPLELEFITKEDNIKLPLLIPGIGKQGGSLKDCVEALNVRSGSTPPFIINQSSTFLCAADDKNFYEASAAVLKKQNDDVNAILSSS